MEQDDPLNAFFSRVKQHRIPMSAICEEAGVAPTTPSRWKRKKNGATLDRIRRLNDALTKLVEAA